MTYHVFLNIRHCKNNNLRNKTLFEGSVQTLLNSQNIPTVESSANRMTASSSALPGNKQTIAKHCPASVVARILTAAHISSHHSIPSDITPRNPSAFISEIDL